MAGCLGSEDASGLIIRNGLDYSVSFTVEITRSSDDELVFSESGSLPAGESISFDEPVPEAGLYTLRATADGREESYEWTVSNSDSEGVELVFEPDGWSFTEVRG